MIKKYIHLITLFCFCIFVKAQEKSYTLAECIAIALERNISIKQSQLDYENAKIDKQVAIGNILPSINLQGSHSWNVGLNQNITTGLLEDITTQFTSLGGRANLTIYNGLQNINRIHRANLSILAQEYRLANMIDDIRLLIANAYLQILFNKEIWQVQEKQLSVSRQELERSKKLLDGGLLIPGDLYELEASLSNQEQLLVQAKNNYRLAKINLSQLLLFKEYGIFEIADETFDVPISEILTISPKAIFNKSLTIRNDVKFTETNIEIAKKDLKISKGNLQPSISAFYSYGSRISYANRLILATDEFVSSPVPFYLENIDIGGTNIDRIEGTINLVNNARKEVPPLPFSEQFSLNDGHNFGFQINVPVFNGFAASASVKRNKINLLRSQNQSEQQKLDLENTINQAYNNAEAAYQFYIASGKTLDSRKKAYENASKRYEVGAMDSFNFVQIKQLFETAISDNIRAKYDYIFKLKVIEFYFGINISLD